MKFYCLCQRFHPMMSWKVCTNLRIRESAQLKTVLDCCDLEFHPKISVLREYQKTAGNGEKKDSFRKEISVVSCAMRIGMENRYHCTLFPLNHRQKGW